MDIILKDREIVVSIKNNLREINLGPWEGKTRQEISHSYPDEYIAFCEKQNLFNLTGADTFQDLQNRVVDKFELIFANEKNKNSLVVSHWITIN